MWQTRPGAAGCRARRSPAPPGAAQSSSSAVSSPTGELEPASTSTRQRATRGGGCPTFRSPSTTRWQRRRRAGSTSSAATRTRRRGAARTAFVLAAARWRRLPPLPSARAAAGAAVIGDTLYVAGGVGLRGLARSMLALDIARRRWRALPGPTPREHLGVTTLGGRALRRRRAGSPGRPLVARAALVAASAALAAERVAAGAARRDRRPPSPRLGSSPPAPSRPPARARPSTPTTRRANRWRRLPDLPTARHGLAVVGIGDDGLRDRRRPASGALRQRRERVARLRASRLSRARR